MLKERPIFLHNQENMSPHSIDSALLKRSLSHTKVLTLRDFVIPKDKTMRQLVHELTLESKEVLSLIAGETVAIFLNKQVMNQSFAVNKLIFILDLLYKKNPHNLLDSLAQVKETKDTRTYSLTLLNKKVVTRHVSQIVSTKQISTLLSLRK